MPCPPPFQPAAQPRRSWWAIPLLLLSTLCLWNAVPTSTATPLSATPLAAATPHPTINTQGVAKKLRTTPIGEIRLGMRVLAENPELAGQHLPDTPIDPATWRTIALTMTKPDGGRLDMEFLRSQEWQEETGANSIGDVIELDLPELNVSGPATVTSITPCPSLETSEGRLVTGRFVHESADVIDLYVEGLDKPIGATANHLFWSDDRKEFVPAEQLKKAELLKCADGICREIVDRHQGTAARVFNLEIDQEHVYNVSVVGVVVHNTYPGEGTPWEIIDRFRSKKPGMVELGDAIPVKGDGLGTVAYVDLNGKKVFGVNSKALINDADKALGRMWRERMGFESGQAQALFHAEALSLMRAHKKAGGVLPKEMTLFVDRLTCGPCQGALPALVQEMGIYKLTIFTKDGHVGDIINGVWQGWR